MSLRPSGSSCGSVKTKPLSEIGTRSNGRTVSRVCGFSSRSHLPPGGDDDDALRWVERSDANESATRRNGETILFFRFVFLSF